MDKRKIYIDVFPICNNIRQQNRHQYKGQKWHFHEYFDPTESLYHYWKYFWLNDSSWFISHKKIAHFTREKLSDDHIKCKASVMSLTYTKCKFLADWSLSVTCLRTATSEKNTVFDSFHTLDILRATLKATDFFFPNVLASSINSAHQDMIIAVLHDRPKSNISR